MIIFYCFFQRRQAKPNISFRIFSLHIMALYIFIIEENQYKTVWFGLKKICSENKSCSFLWINGEVQNLGSVWPKLNELQLFLIFAYFSYLLLKFSRLDILKRGCQDQRYFLERISWPAVSPLAWVFLVFFRGRYDVSAIIYRHKK